MKREEKKNATKSEKLAQLRSDLSSFIYHKNGDEPAVLMGRTYSSWAKISLFFFVYYCCLAAFFAAMFAIAFSTMPDTKDGPKYTSIISNKPLLLAYPEGSWNVDDVKNFVKDYGNTRCHLKPECRAGDGLRPSTETKQCSFNDTTLGPCAHAMISSNGPRCYYLRLSKLYDWSPEPENSGKFIKLKCEAPDGNANITHFPKADEAFPISFWPFRGEDGFTTPLAAIQVEGQGEVTIQCTAIADNIETSKTWKLRKGAYGKIEFDAQAS